MFETLKNAFQVKEIRRKIWYTLLFILLYRLGSFIPVPGIEAAVFTSTVGGNDFLGIMSAISGGSLSNGTLFAMGIGPYINASIIIQLLTIAIPALERLAKQGEEGRKKISQITRYTTLGLAIVQAIAILLATGEAGIDFTILGGIKWLTYAMIVTIFIAGSALTMWIGERITDQGVGNGMTMLIFVGILATAGNTFLNQSNQIFMGNVGALWSFIGFIITVIIIFGCIVTVDLAERRIPVQYAKQVKGRKMYGGQSTFIPIRVNSSGVLPLIFAFAIISMPDLFCGLFWPGSQFQIWWSRWVGYGSWVHPILLAALILFFTYFYSTIQFNPADVSKNIQQYGGFIPGIRPGKPTTQYLTKINSRITFFGAIYLALVALVPSLLFRAIGGVNGVGLIGAFSTTGLLIVVSGALDINNALESQLMMRHYKGFLK